MHAKRFELLIPAIKPAEANKLQKLNFITLLDSLGGMLSTAIIDAALLSKKPMPIEFLLQGMPFAGADIRQQLHLFADYLTKTHPDSGADVKATIASIDLSPATFSDLRTDLVAIKASSDDIAQVDFLLALHGNVEAADRLAGYAVSCLDDAPLMLPFSIGLQKHAHRTSFRLRNGGRWEWRSGVELEILNAGCLELSTHLSFLAGSVQSMSAWMRGLQNDRGAASERARAVFEADLIQSMISQAYKRSLQQSDDEYRAENEIDSLIVTDEQIAADEAEWRAEAAATEAEIASEGKKTASVSTAGVRTLHTGDTEINEPTVCVLRKLDLTGVNTSENPVLKAFFELGGRQLPLTIASYDLPTIRTWLLETWPHAPEVVDAALRDMQPGKSIATQPLLIVGDPGCGKTSFLTVLAEALELQSVVYPCASVADGSFGGTPSQWSSRRCSVPAELIRSTLTANPAVILDELEKTGQSDRNGSLVHALLPMLEKHSAERYFETAIEKPFNLAHVNFWATANSVTDIPAPLRDRFRIVRMPNPGPEHIGSLARQIIERIDRLAGRDERWTPPLATDELEVIRKAWSGGSLRKLTRAVEATLAARAAMRSWH